MNTAEKGAAGGRTSGGADSKELAEAIKGQLVGIDFVDLLFALVVSS